MSTPKHENSCRCYFEEGEWSAFGFHYRAMTSADVRRRGLTNPESYIGQPTVVCICPAYKAKMQASIDRERRERSQGQKPVRRFEE